MKCCTDARIFNIQQFLLENNFEVIPITIGDL